MCRSTATVEVFAQLEQEHSTFDEHKPHVRQAEEPTLSSKEQVTMKRFYYLVSRTRRLELKRKQT